MSWAKQWTIARGPGTATGLVTYLSGLIPWAQAVDT